MRRIILASVTRPVLPYFSTFAQDQHDFREKKVIEHKMRVLIFLLLSETFLILRRLRWDTVINVHRSSRKVPVILVRF